MTFRYIVRFLSCLGMVGLVAVGCAVQDPPALTQLYGARDAIMAAKQAGVEERFPGEYAELEKRYLLGRGTFYACQEAKALAMAQELITDANALAVKRVAAPAPPSPGRVAEPASPAALPNQPPVARLRSPAEGEINTALTFHGEESYDPDGGPLTYIWHFGDGTTASATSSTVAHQYASVGNYNVRLTVEDGQGGTDTTMSLVAVVKREVIRSDVLFGFDQATLRPEAQEVLAGIVQSLQKDTSSQAVLVGHTDSAGPAEYNMDLSKRRAFAVRDFLIAQGVGAERITAEWKGETEPVTSNTTREGRAQNRRTEITLRPTPPVVG